MCQQLIALPDHVAYRFYVEIRSFERYGSGFEQDARFFDHDASLKEA
jgi:hypothetical protein